MRVAIADLVVDLRFEDPARERWARDRYAAYRSARRPDLRLNVRTADAVRPRPLRLPPAGPRILVSRTRAEVRIEGRELSVRLDPRTGRGEAVLSERRFPMNVLLRTVVSLHLLPRGGMLLHAAGVRAGDGAFVLPGRSGAGKTTFARRFPPRDVLSDEVVAVRLWRGRAEASGTPFPGDLGRPGRSGWLPLLGFVFLGSRRRSGGMRPIRPVSATVRLLAATLGGWASEPDVRALAENAVRLVRAVPCAEASFSPGAARRDLVRMLDAWPTGGSGNSGTVDWT